ncbi:MAG TPA: DNA methyltransferase [Lacipirellulaceae bacterium]
MPKNARPIPADIGEPDINYPLVETTRPQLYRAMKYWGKKPHNIWAEYIERYCPAGGIVLDPFAGSAVAAFETVKLGRKAIVFDLNPLSSFIVEVTASPFDEPAFRAAFNRVCKATEATDVYTKHYIRTRSDETATVLNYRWEAGELAGVAALSNKVYAFTRKNGQ